LKGCDAPKLEKWPPAKEGAEFVEITKIVKNNLPPPKAAAPKPEPVAPASIPKDGDRGATSAEPSPTVSKSELQKAARELEVRFNLKVEMATDETTGRGVVRIFSEDGERLLRQLPPEQVLHMADEARQGNLESILNSMV